ncbi:MAG: cell division protein FtsZ [Patescibacteria group bacterium]
MNNKNVKNSSKAPNDYSAKIKVIGVGGGGGNAVSRMRDSISVKGIEFIAINTDAQDLDYCNAKTKIYIGKNLTRGLGTGMNPDIGRQAAEENRSDIVESLKGADLVFITAGLGGGTGSGASVVVAEAAKEIGALTVAVVTKPFLFEGAQRSRIATEALVKLKDKVDTLIVIPNDRIFSIIQKDTPIIKAFEHVDGVLMNAVQGIAELIAMPGIINVDFADVKAIMQDAGQALIGIGSGSGQDRAINAVTQAVSSPLVEVSIDGAKGVLFGIAGGRDLKMNEINEVAKVIAENVDPAAKIIFGAYHDRKIKNGRIKITLIAAGFNGHVIKDHEPASSTLFGLPSINEQSNQEEREAKKEKKEKPKDSKEKDSDIWDIPTFLRKKK